MGDLDWGIIAGAAISIATAILVFVLNAKATRDLERSKIYRDTKLEAFKSINNSIVGIRMVYESFRNLLSNLKTAEPDETHLQLVMEYISHSRDIEKVLGTNVSERCIERYKQLIRHIDSNELEGAIRRINEEVFVRNTITSLTILNQRVLGHHIRMMEIARSNACLVSDNPHEISKELLCFCEYVTTKWGEVLTSISQELAPSRVQKSIEKEKYTPDEGLVMMVTNILDTMRDELENTMVSTWSIGFHNNGRSDDTPERGISPRVLALSQIAITLWISGLAIVFSVLIAEGSTIRTIYIGGILMIVAGGWVAVKSIKLHELHQRNSSERIP